MGSSARDPSLRRPCLRRSCLPRHGIDAATEWFHAAFCLDVRSLAAFRMLTGAIVAADALLRTRDFHLMFSPDGFFPPELLRAFQGDPSMWSACFAFDSSWWQACVLALEGAAGVALAVGFQTRLATVLAWFAVVSVVRRTMPATNSGDEWLAAMLFWSILIPLGDVWSIDAWRGRPPGRAGCRLAVPLVLQIMLVYLASGLSKLAGGWLALDSTGSADAAGFALSVHDHGTPVGEWIASLGWPTRLLTPMVVLLELLGPILALAVPTPAVRGAIVIAFMAFHAGIAVCMTVGLFAPIGLAAWAAIIPEAAWDRLRITAGKRPCVDAARPGTSPVSRGLQAVFGSAALVAWLHAVGPWSGRPLPSAVSTIVNLAGIRQDWGMFGDVPAQRQWVYGRAELADGRLVDPLRNGRPLETELPRGGYGSLPHHRWHKIFWELPKPGFRPFGRPVARAIAEAWNESHAASERIESLELRAARRPVPDEGTLAHDILLGSWPARDDRGTGNLERFLESDGRRAR